MNIGFEHSCISLLKEIGTVSLVYVHIGVELLPSLTLNVCFSLSKAVASMDGGEVSHLC